MDPSALLKWVSDGTPIGMAAIFLVLFIWQTKENKTLQSGYIDLLKENIETNNKMRAVQEAILALLKMK